MSNKRGVHATDTKLTPSVQACDYCIFIPIWLRALNLHFDQANYGTVVCLFYDSWWVRVYNLCMTACMVCTYIKLQRYTYWVVPHGTFCTDKNTDIHLFRCKFYVQLFSAHSTSDVTHFFQSGCNMKTSAAMTEHAVNHQNCSSLARLLMPQRFWTLGYQQSWCPSVATLFDRTPCLLSHQG
jgi:hypothetical protein